MEIETTIKDFPERVKNLDVPPETPIRVIIHDVEISMPEKPKKVSGQKWRSGFQKRIYLMEEPVKH